jgi:nitroreductase
MPHRKIARTARPIHDVIARRWSARAIDQERPVARDHLVSVLEAARWAPSCFGEEPWRFLVWDRFEDEASWQTAFDCLTAGNRAWVRRTPVLLATAADGTFGNGKPNRWGQYDTGAASENLCLQATALGLVAHQMGGFDRARLAEAFRIPDRFTAMAMIALGHPGDPAGLPENKQAEELAERSRRPFGETCFNGTWDRPLET